MCCIYRKILILNIWRVIIEINWEKEKSASCWSLLCKFSASVKVFLLQTTISIIHQAINHYSHQEHVTSNVNIKVQTCRPEACYLYPQFAHSSFRFAGNPDKVGRLSSPFFTHVIQTCVTRGWNLLTCKANCTIFVISFISACYMFRLCGPSSGIKIHDCNTQNCWQQYICQYWHYVP
jgi:hypothetical protein